MQSAYTAGSAPAEKPWPKSNSRQIRLSLKMNEILLAFTVTATEELKRFATPKLKNLYKKSIIAVSTLESG